MDLLTYGRQADRTLYSDIALHVFIFGEAETISLVAINLPTIPFKVIPSELYLSIFYGALHSLLKKNIIIIAGDF